MSMMRQPSHSSSMSGSPASPKAGRYSIFRKKTSMSSSVPRDEPGSSDKIYEPSHSDKMLNPNSPFSMPDLETSRSNGLPSPDSFIAATHDTEYQHLRENIRRIRKAASDAKKVDAAWEVYKKLRDESLQLCKSLLAKSRKGPSEPRFYWGHSEAQKLMDVESNIRRESLEYASIGPLDTRSSLSSSVTETALPFQVNDQWLTAIREYKATQELMLRNLRNTLLDKYLEYEPNASERQVEAFLADKARRKNLIAQMRDTSVHRMKSEKHMFWDQYQIRSSDFEKLKLDVQAIEQLFNQTEGDEDGPNMSIRECVIAKNGDTILEFANVASENHPILRFRVSSHLLAEHSPLFAQFLSPQSPGNNPPLDMISQLPPPPTRHICKDGMEVKVYRMPQIELNNQEAFKILMHAAHMHKDRVPRQISFPTFVSVAEVCLKYECTQPLEMHVEYQWLPQWVDKLEDDKFDGFLVISYAFGLRRIFTRMSKTAILNAADEDEIRSKELWPQAVRGKIIATRAAKLAQIYDCCTGAIEEYFKTPSEVTDRRASVVGSLQLSTSPRCPRGSHVCDATNLGWLMLVYNELRVLPSIMKNVGFHNLPKPPKRSLKELVDCLRLMPTAPQVHSGVCDHAPLFRSAINDVYNSVTGLTLRDVSGKSGWALSKHAGPTDDHDDDMVRDLVELEAPLESLKETKRAVAMSNEEISFRILSNLDEMDDLTAAAMIDQSFYRAYKRNEATLLKNIINAERRRTMSQANPDVAPIRRALKAEATNGLNISIPRPGEEPKSLATDRLKFPPPSVGQPSSNDDLYDASPPFSPTSYEELTQEEHDEAYRIIWGEVAAAPQPAPPKANGHLKQPIERNDKCLVGDVAHTGDKARLMEEEDKHLRDEQERELGQGKYKKNE